MEYLEINGWKIYFHSCFLSQLTDLAKAVSALKQKKPDEYKGKKETKLLAAIEHIITQVIPANPLDAQFRQGDTLGPDYRHWYRVKFKQQFRLFFRFSEKHKTIIVGWVNDFDTLRAYGSKTDAYMVFERMLKSGEPPDDWDVLFKQSQTATQTMASDTFPK
ncbi:type II toxin-antitoxin system YhaV family toxin [Pantoea cypripedii]|uniref:Toxin YhaV n=1 Tax=Pantoea cypripedii TaxID=55209 RepID=A0A1X1EY78_PANCY|nr:type II toxin-antitoxin system YhaV family toxin [Pantoea cypripedii]MBP2195149.1 toxin YhaV [Pantoea cypripedii]ORM94986.1 toxin YhaV [Pantoea cypripedii]